MKLSTNLGQTWNFVHYLRHICSCSNKAHVQILMNVKECWNNFMFVIIRKENWIVIEFNCDNFVAFTTRCWCQNPISINHSSNTKIVLLSFVFKRKDKKNEKGRKFETSPVNRNDIDRNFEKSVLQHMRVLQRMQFFRPLVYPMVVQSEIRIFFVLFGFSLLNTFQVLYQYHL